MNSEEDVHPNSLIHTFITYTFIHHLNAQSYMFDFSCSFLNCVRVHDSSHYFWEFSMDLLEPGNSTESVLLHYNVH